MMLPDVLVVDDDEMDLELFRRYMHKHGLGNRVFEASSGDQAIQLLSGAFQPAPQADCVVLIDINMPRMDGLTLLAHIREIPSWQSAKCFMLTSSSFEDDVLRARRSGVDGYVLKHRLDDALAGTTGNLREHLLPNERPAVA